MQPPSDNTGGPMAPPAPSYLRGDVESYLAERSLLFTLSASGHTGRLHFPGSLAGRPGHPEVPKHFPPLQWLLWKLPAEMVASRCRRSPSSGPLTTGTAALVSPKDAAWATGGAWGLSH